MYLVDHRGKIIWEHWGYHHIDSGWVGKISAGQEGMQCLAVDIVDKEEAKEGPWKLIEPSAILWNSDGTLLGNPPPSWYDSIPLDWDGDGIRTSQRIACGGRIFSVTNGRKSLLPPVVEKSTSSSTQPFRKALLESLPGPIDNTGTISPERPCRFRSSQRKEGSFREERRRNNFRGQSCHLARQAHRPALWGCPILIDQSK
jgi:hypothetical protein